MSNFNLKIRTNFNIPEKKNTVKSKFFKAKNDFKLDCDRTLDIEVMESKVLENGSKIILTPSSINDKYHNPNETFKFGVDSELNDYNFPSDEKMGKRQFSIKYDQSKESFKN